MTGTITMETKILTQGTMKDGIVAVLKTSTIVERVTVTETEKSLNKIVDILFSNKVTIHEAFFALSALMTKEPVIVSSTRYSDLSDPDANCFCVTAWDGQNYFQIDILDYVAYNTGRSATFFLTEESFARLK